MKRAIAYAILILVYFLAPFGALNAVEPTFPTCANPQGSVKATYTSGTHGIVGDTTKYEGSDTVYQVNADQLTQCFCPATGNGIQTNWLKATGLSEVDIKAYQAAGWTYVPYGSDWGLDDAPYLAKNINYSCFGGKGGGGSAGGSGVSDGRSSCPECTATPKSPEGGSVLGLASTGSLPSIVVLLVMGVVALGVSKLIRKQTKVPPSKAFKTAKKTSKKKRKKSKK